MWRLLLTVVFSAGTQVRGFGQDGDGFTLQADEDGVRVFA